MSTEALWADGGIIDEIAIERAEQDAKWGEQNHPIIWESSHTLIPVAGGVFHEMAEKYKALNDSSDPSDWAGILLEEVYEALSEADPQRIRDELVQVAAVAAAAIESLDRNELNEHWRKS